MPRKEKMIKNAFTNAKNIAKKFNDTANKMDKRTKEEFRKDIRQRRVKRNKEFSGKDGSKGGKLYIFQYDAIHKQNIYDKKPFIVSLGDSKRSPAYMLGLNINWVKRQDHRTNLVALILQLLDKDGNLDYEASKMILKRFKKSPILRMYKKANISQNMIKVPRDQFLIASRFNGPQFS